MLVLLDGSNPTVAGSVLSAAALVRRLTGQVCAQSSSPFEGPVGGAGASPVRCATRVLYNPDLLSSYNLVPGLVRDDPVPDGDRVCRLAIVKGMNSTIEQLIVTPIRSWELIVAKIIPYILVSFANTVLIMAVGTFLFGVPLRGSLVLLFSLVGLYLLPTPRTWAFDLHRGKNTTTGAIDDHAHHAAIHAVVRSVLSDLILACISSDGRKPFAPHLFCLYFTQHCY